MPPLKNCLVAVAFTFLLFFTVPVSIFKDLDELAFQNFLIKYNKSYENSTEYQYRLKAFKESLFLIKTLNSKRNLNSSALYGITPFSDFYEHEFLNKYLQKDYSKRRSLRKFVQTEKNHSGSKEKRSLLNLPEKIDWRLKGYVTDVNNQHSCGACWAFSTVEVIESINAIKTGNLVKLSTQQIIDCARYNNDGCNGGDMCTLLAWIKDKNIALKTENEYPLHLKNEVCKMNNEDKGGVQIQDYTCSEFIDQEDDILDLLANQGPIAVAINALSWQNYIGGVIQYHCSSHPLLLNHAVQIVGYNTKAEIPYYIVRNSWGRHFGEDGYLYIEIGKNLCGLATEVVALII